MSTPVRPSARLRRGASAAVALAALTASAASAQQYYAAPPAQQSFVQQAPVQQAPVQQALQSAAPDLASVYAAYGQPQAQTAANSALAYAQSAQQAYVQPAQQAYVQAQQTYVQPVQQAVQQQATAAYGAYVQPVQQAAAPIYNPAPAPQQTYVQPQAQSYVQPAPAQAWPSTATAVPAPTSIGGGYVQPAQPAAQAQTPWPGYGYAPQQTAYAPPPPPAGPSLAGWERGFASNIEAVNACLKATALTDVSVTGVLTENVSRETHVILNGRFSNNTQPRREFCAWSPTRREARMLDATGRPQFESEGAPSYAPVGARFSFANLAALPPVVDTDSRLLGWMRWEKTGVQPASSRDLGAPPAVDVHQPMRLEGFRWS